jgi:hypothetical protein
MDYSSRIIKDDGIEFIDLKDHPYYHIKFDKTSKKEEIYEHDVYIPAEPEDHLCVNYGLSEYDQIFRLTYIPKQVLEAESYKARDKWRPEEIDAFIDAEWNRRRNGHMFRELFTLK